MSAYIVDDNIINRIVTWIYKEFDLSPNFKKNFCERLNDINKANLRLAMINMNIEAVNQRYSEKTKLRKFFNCSNIEADDVQVCKSMSCWLYQCSEGNIGERDLYKLFKEYVHIYLLKKIVYNSKEYQEAKWWAAPSLSVKRN